MPNSDQRSLTDSETNIDDCASNPCYARSTVACIDR